MARDRRPPQKAKQGRPERAASTLMVPVPTTLTGQGPGLLSEQQAKYVEARGMGLAPMRAAKHAGYARPETQAYEQEKNPAVAAAIRALLAQNMDLSKMTRQKVMDIVTDAIEMARTLEDPTAMLKGAQELSKMLGFYVPETKNILISAKREQARGELALLTEQELIELAGGYEGVLEGEFTVVDTESDRDSSEKGEEDA